MWSPPWATFIFFLCMNWGMTTSVLLGMLPCNDIEFYVNSQPSTFVLTCTQMIGMWWMDGWRKHDDDDDHIKWQYSFNVTIASIIISTTVTFLSSQFSSSLGHCCGLARLRKKVVKKTRHNTKDILQQQFGEHAKFCLSLFDNVMYTLWKNKFINRGTHLLMLHLVCDLLMDPEKHYHLFHRESATQQFEDFCIMQLVSDVEKQKGILWWHHSSSRKRLLEQIMSEWSTIRLKRKQEEEYLCETFAEDTRRSVSEMYNVIAKY